MSSIILLKSDNYFPTLQDAILSSRSSIQILLYQFNRYVGNSTSKVNLITHALLKAHQKGVSIQIILNASFHSKQAAQVNHSTVEFFRHQGISARLGPVNLRIHSKLFIFDASRVILGSHNLSERALSKNIELSLLIENEPLATKLTQLFHELWNTP